MRYITRGLVSVLLDFAHEQDPEQVSIGLTVTRAGTLTGAESLSTDTPVFTHFYHPNTGESVTAVFGMDLGMPRSHGRFVSHPDGSHELSLEDDLHEVVFVAVPPWHEITAFDRSGSPLPVTVLDAEPPTESIV
ncbi:hypothetical protein [Halocatena pleomorpha]|uniref:Uncharacterized protein n=1 Tax=Halocatena pleomorpha TaxID=1785090 RepID=A0A3P3RAA4_9EURY|nr:hypothetical protein [Halocatena pleomorpha]RRJ29848.1 hypothetical protein EIK79_11655 [Halocatena pleomorpha]